MPIVKNIVFIFLIFFTCSAFAIDYGGNFSERSVLMRSIYGEPASNKEQKELLASRKLNPSTKCLIDEIKKGNSDNVKLLLEAKVDPNKSYISDYPIYVASKYNKADIVKLLRESGAKLNMGFYSELYEAIKNKNSELAKYLIDEGANVNYRDSVTEHTILYLALKNNMKDIASLLIQKGARPDNQSVRYIQRHKLGDLIPSE